MYVILVPGMWLDASAWDDVAPVLRAAGHEVEALTLPGMHPGDDPASVGFEDQVQAVVDRVDAASRTTSGAESIALVGHSASGAVVGVAVDRRAARIRAAVYVDAIPFPEGDWDNDEFPVVDGVVPFPERSAFGDAMVRDTTDEQWAALQARAIPVPAGATRQHFRLTDEARRRVPTTVITSEMSPDELTAGITAHADWATELAATEDLRIVGLDTGHWAMSTRPAELGALIVEALAPRPTQGV
ncbi:alpha/beta hydrolase [Curtobacterium sp. MCBD17_034]|uniref:alpha/beta hydrolase n=1 Tax=unclassified Curtobacterium TaxID=257496 RepID=UPI000DA7D0ED|nr:MULTISPECIES: alpha/beta hydrolase [unclassified Curtobacterium]PZF62380.1 alpha/beta hydrolase [Curtobacterium sp. MCBD17_034]PZM39914.1 alpha/beta hydrolase [Curtobacterium sp. MCBD17_031]